MELFTVKMKGAFKIVFRKSLNVDTKESLCNKVKEALSTQAPTAINKGVLTIYITPTTDNILQFADQLRSIKSSEFTWDDHFRN